MGHRPTQGEVRAAIKLGIDFKVTEPQKEQLREIAKCAEENLFTAEEVFDATERVAPGLGEKLRSILKFVAVHAKRNALPWLGWAIRLYLSDDGLDATVELPDIVSPEQEENDIRTTDRERGDRCSPVKACHEPESPSGDC